ncbi:hypothetical protein [Photorhabdus sp. SF281]
MINQWEGKTSHFIIDFLLPRYKLLLVENHFRYHTRLMAEAITYYI